MGDLRVAASAAFGGAPATARAFEEEGFSSSRNLVEASGDALSSLLRVAVLLSVEACSGLWPPRTFSKSSKAGRIMYTVQ